ncbi:MAG: alpha/beta hydrolase [Bacteroidales bacterium]|nr:alpha/beta hydrolase [Bacteroidales bacterium]MBR5777859.1 alpha/beta hydrolase [Bacteroidales bacterium]
MNIEHFYIENGQGSPIIMLHGNTGKARYFKHQIDVFAQKYHVYAIDTRGHGKTPRGEKPFTIRQFADDLLAFMNNHGIEKATLMGFSDGGNIAMRFAIEYPEKVDRLILNGANLNARGVKNSTQIPIELKYYWYKLLGIKKHDVEMLGLMVNDPNITLEELRSIHAKTLVIVGTNDIIKEKHSKLIASTLSNSEFAVVDGDHFVALRNPEAFNERVLEFLAK